MALIISDETLAKAQFSPNQLLIELACYLYDKKRMSMGQARTLAELDQISFLQELAKEKVIFTTRKEISTMT